MSMTTFDQSKRKALGKGLESLLPTNRPAIATAQQPESGRPREIAVNLIDRNPYQTRTHFDEKSLAELAASVAANGVLQPVLLRPAAGGRYQLIAGERRWLASQRAGKQTIPAVVKEVSDQQALEITIVENLQRADLNPMEQARAYERLSREFNLTQEQMAQRTGKERASVANFLRLLKLPTEIQAKVENDELSFGHAKVLLMLDSPEAIAKAAVKVMALSMSVRQTESYIQGILHPEKKQKEEKPQRTVDANVHDAERMLQSSLGMKVRIDDKKGKGKITIEYSSLEDFDRLLEMLENKSTTA